MIHNFPWMNLTKECFTLTRGNRIPEQSGIAFDERKFLNILGMAVKNAYSSISTPEDSLKNAQEQLERYFKTRF